MHENLTLYNLVLYELSINKLKQLKKLLLLIKIC